MTEILKCRGMLHHVKTTYNRELHGRKGDWHVETQLKTPLSHSMVNLTALNMTYTTFRFLVLLKFSHNQHGTKTHIRNDSVIFREKWQTMVPNDKPFSYYSYFIYRP
jgi:hypothetical protein